MSMGMRQERDFSAAVCQPFLLEGGEHAVLLIHGFTGSAAHMRLVGERLHAQGFTVQGINLPGHGESMEAMAKSGWQDWLSAAREAVVSLKKRYPKVSVAGLSMGGCLALILAEQMELDACATISAPMGTKNGMLRFCGIASLFVKRIIWSSNPERQRRVDERYDYGYPGFPTRCGADLHRLIGLARRNLHAVRCPLLVIQSHDDETIIPESAEIILAGVSSEKKGMVWLEDVPHACTISREYGRIADAVAELLHTVKA